VSALSDPTRRELKRRLLGADGGDATRSDTAALPRQYERDGAASHARESSQLAAYVAATVRLEPRL